MFSPAPLYGQNSSNPSTYDAESAVPLRSHLLDYVRVLYRRRWIALPILLLIAGLFAFSAFTATPVYEAQTQLLMEVENRNVVTFKEVIEEDRATADYYETQYSILRSRAVARRTLDALNLWDHPEFAGGGPSSFSLRGAVDEGASQLVSFVSAAFDSQPESGADDPEQRADESAAQAMRIDRFLSRLSVEPVRNSRLVDVKFRSADPQLAALAANTLATEYVELLQDFTFQASKEASIWLGQRLAEQDRSVENAELRLQRYREENEVVGAEGQSNIVAQKLADLSSAVTKARTERINKEILYNQLKAIQNEQKAIDTFPAILANPYIQQLKAEVTTLQQQHAQLSERLAERHPEMIKARTALEAAQSKLDAEGAKIVQAIENDYLAARAQENRLLAEVDKQKRELLDQDRRAIKFDALQRNATSDRQLYESLLQRAKETGISGELKTSNIRIVDVADTPRAPITPRKARSLALGLLSGAVLGIGLAFFFEYLDKRIKSPDEMKTLGLPFLGLVPAVPKKSNDKSALTLTDGGSPHFAEALKGVRTKLLVADGPEQRSLLVTSTSPNEGKTFTAAHLAVALAQASRRVLLVDADMRQPKVHEALGVERAPGLSNVILGTALVSEVMRPSAVPGLWVLAAGDRPANAAELLASKRFESLLKAAGQHFDWVIIDSPPVLAVTDACVIAPLLSGVLFVVGSEMTTKQSVQAALEELEAVNARFVGTVLNRVQIYKHAYYYSDYYKTEYGQYYESMA